MVSSHWPRWGVEQPPQLLVPVRSAAAPPSARDHNSHKTRFGRGAWMSRRDLGAGRGGAWSGAGRGRDTKTRGARLGGLRIRLDRVGSSDPESLAAGGAGRGLGSEVPGAVRGIRAGKPGPRPALGAQANDKWEQPTPWVL